MFMDAPVADPLISPPTGDPPNVLIPPLLRSIFRTTERSMLSRTYRLLPAAYAAIGWTRCAPAAGPPSPSAPGPSSVVTVVVVEFQDRIRLLLASAMSNFPVLS